MDSFSLKSRAFLVAGLHLKAYLDFQSLNNVLDFLICLGNLLLLIFKIGITTSGFKYYIFDVIILPLCCKLRSYRFAADLCERVHKFCHVQSGLAGVLVL